MMQAQCLSTEPEIQHNFSIHCRYYFFKSCKLSLLHFLRINELNWLFTCICPSMDFSFLQAIGFLLYYALLPILPLSLVFKQSKFLENGYGMDVFSLIYS